MYPRRDTCSSGHAFTPSNTRHTATGARCCLACHRREARESARRRRRHQQVYEISYEAARVPCGHGYDTPYRPRTPAPVPPGSAAALFCDPAGHAASRVYGGFATAAAAAAFANDCPNPECTGMHLIACRADGKVTVQVLGEHPPRSLADELAAAYPHHACHHPCHQVAIGADHDRSP